MVCFYIYFFKDKPKNRRNKLPYTYPYLYFTPYTAYKLTCYQIANLIIFLFILK